MRITRTLASAAALATALTLSLSPALAAEQLFSERARQAVKDALQSTRDLDTVADILASLAWPSDPGRDPEVGALARSRLVSLGHQAFQPLARAIHHAPAIYGADIVEAIQEARQSDPTGVPPDYLPVLDEALWFGSPEAKRLAMLELARSRHVPSQMAAIDAAYDYPQLIDTTIVAMSMLGDHRARWFLEEQLASPDATRRHLAASALVSIGGLAYETLRNAVLSDDRRVRLTAIEALLPFSSGDDLTVLYEFAERNRESEPDLVERVLRRASQLEALVEAQTQQETREVVGDF